MLNDLANPTIQTTQAAATSAISRFARKLLVGMSLVLAIGLTGVSFARSGQTQQDAERRPTIVWVGRGAILVVPQQDTSNVESDEELLRDVDESDLEDEAEARPARAVINAQPQVVLKRTILMEVTAYCPCTKCCGPKAQGMTASGKPVSYNAGRFVAADTSKLPFGTKLSIPGYHAEQPVEVIDRGGAIKGNKLDVFFATHQEALKWGRQKLMVTIEER
jgi:3D (Asp-Asp-Asp) domain-containing protein